MVFSSLTFLFFFLPCTLVAYYAWPNRPWRNALLLLASILFYAWGEPVYILLFLVSIGANWGLALAIVRFPAGKRPVLAAGIALNLLSIGIFKYAGFVVGNVNGVLGTTWPVPAVALPIGISFYTFQAISYLVDVYRGSVRPQRNPIFFGTYLGMFPQLIAGPIVRYKTIETEILGRRESLDEFTAGLERFCMGLGKKLLLANTTGYIADHLLAASPTVGAFPAWFAFVAYAFQIYFDFSGYSDMAIGLGRMFGFHFLENFDYPYVAKSVTEFWRRWHISLSTFFRDYVYIPLGGNRVRTPRWIVNLLVVWALTGLWHGARWNFVFWGCYYGVFLIGEKLLWGRLLRRLPHVMQHLYTIMAFLIGWVFFRVEDFPTMARWLAALFGAYGLGDWSTLTALGVAHLWPWLLVGALLSTPRPRRLLQRLADHPLEGLAHVSWATFILLWSILALVVGGFNPFIYFRF
jgi:alginate O-acetyltransferase complex protein AlgI